MHNKRNHKPVLMLIFGTLATLFYMIVALVPSDPCNGWTISLPAIILMIGSAIIALYGAYHTKGN